MAPYIQLFGRVYCTF